MIYVVNKGVRRTPSQKLIKALLALMPLMAIALISAAVFSNSSWHAIGQRPNISKPQVLGLSISPSSASPPTGGASSSGSNTPNPYYVPQTTQATMPAPTTTDVLTSAPAAISSGAPGPTIPNAGNPNPVQTTVTVPALNVQTGDKQILSTPGTPLTVN